MLDFPSPPTLKHLSFFQLSAPWSEQSMCFQVFVIFFSGIQFLSSESCLRIAHVLVLSFAGFLFFTIFLAMLQNFKGSGIFWHDMRLILGLHFTSPFISRRYFFRNIERFYKGVHRNYASILFRDQLFCFFRSTFQTIHNSSHKICIVSRKNIHVDSTLSHSILLCRAT